MYVKNKYLIVSLILLQFSTVEILLNALNLLCTQRVCNTIIVLLIFLSETPPINYVV